MYLWTSIWPPKVFSIFVNFLSFDCGLRTADCGLRTIHLFSPLLNGDQFRSYLTTLAQNAIPRIVLEFSTCQIYQNLNALLISMITTIMLLLYLVNWWVLDLVIPGVTHYGAFRGEAIPGRKTLIEDMPLSLQEDVTFEESKDCLEKVIMISM